MILAGGGDDWITAGDRTGAADMLDGRTGRRDKASVDRVDRVRRVERFP